MVSIVITTCNRAALLREALESVRQQTARQTIAQVIVSENSANDASRAVCAAFADLPVVYVQQTPPVPALLHLQQIGKVVQGPVVAFLHDDDWWAPGHLQAALHVLESHQSCAAVFSSFYETRGPQDAFQVSSRSLLVWLASGGDFGHSVVSLDDISVMVAILLGSPFHYSTLVGRREAIWASYGRILETGNEYDNDREFPLFLCAHGSISYLTAPDVYVRMHPEQDSLRGVYVTDGREKMCETTRWLLKTEPAMVHLAAERFNNTVSQLQADRLPNHAVYWLQVLDWIGDPQRTALIDECGLNLRRKTPADGPPRQDFRWFVKQLCPPVLWNVARRIVNVE